VSAFQRASDHEIDFSASALQSKNQETKVIKAKEFIKANKQGQAKMASGSGKRVG